MFSKLPSRDSFKRERVQVSQGPSISLKKPKPDKPNRVEKPNPSSSSTAPAPEHQEDIRTVAADLFLDNKLSAKDVSRVATSAQRCGASGIDDIASAGKHGELPKNLARDILRKLLKGTTMPDLFWCPITGWDPKTKEKTSINIPFLLPHEVLHSMRENTKLTSLDVDNCPEMYQQFQERCAKLQMEPSSCIALGLHGDGVPFTKKDSVELISLNFLAEPHGQRVPFTGISKSYICQCGCLGKHTWDEVMSVLVWSMRSLCVGTFPCSGPLNQTLDAQRAKVAGTPLQVRALLCQIRADWPFLKTLFSFPSWSSERVCWQCSASKSGDNSYRDGSAGAPWRATRRSAAEFFGAMRQEGLTPSPLFSSPGLRLEDVTLDWLHVVDLGIAQDLIGNLFHEAVLGGLDGPNKEARLKVLWENLLQYYSEAKSPSKLDNLTLEMFERAKQPPKLRAKGGETRHLLPYAAELSAFLAKKNNTLHWTTVAELFHLLLECAKLIARRPFEFHELETASRKVTVLWASLEKEALQAGSSVNWRMKPKVHLFQELTQYISVTHGSPELFWTYRDESWCGIMAKGAKRRGGQKNASTVPERLLQRFRAFHQKDDQGV